MSAAHTPGPWGAQVMFFDNLTIGIDYPENDDRDHYLAQVTCGDPDELQANADLIQAAPKLLAALQLFNNDASIECAAGGVYTIAVSGRDLIQMRDAIAKATGSAS